MKKELDLQKFINRQRVTMSAVISLLSSRQKLFCDKFSQLIIRESSDHTNTTSDADLSDWERQDMQFAKKMTISKDSVDQRFVNLYKIRRAIWMTNTSQKSGQEKELGLQKMLSMKVDEEFRERFDIESEEQAQ